MKISALLLRFRSSPAKKTSGMTWRKALGGCQRKRGGWFYENGVGKEEGEAGDEEVEGSSEGELLLVGGPSLSPGFSLLGGFILSLGPQCVCCGSFRGLQVWKRRSELWESLLKGSSGWSPRRTAPHQWGLVLDLACVTETDSPKPPPPTHFPGSSGRQLQEHLFVREERSGSTCASGSVTLEGAVRPRPTRARSQSNTKSPNSCPAANHYICAHTKDTELFFSSLFPRMNSAEEPGLLVFKRKNEVSTAELQTAWHASDVSWPIVDLCFP